MNGEPLPKSHGAPLRVIVTGYIGARSCKWVYKINAIPEPSMGPVQQQEYLYFTSQVLTCLRLLKFLFSEYFLDWKTEREVLEWVFDTADACVVSNVQIHIRYTSAYSTIFTSGAQFSPHKIKK